jgi:hypothetical protein
MQEAPTLSNSPRRPVCTDGGLDVPPAIAALVELLGEETLCAACATNEEDADD